MMCFEVYLFLTKIHDMTYDSSVQHIGWSTYYRFIGVNRLVFTCIYTQSLVRCLRFLISYLVFHFVAGGEDLRQIVKCLVS